jgi:hypothetical protein
MNEAANDIESPSALMLVNVCLQAKWHQLG